mmetsp:Transcript_6230/g.9845  ORF Transcript_6230/g.9845 Transcript_6230/m.9845 type:complete len:106 (-) Transcript_6230:1327-1644(-)
MQDPASKKLSAPDPSNACLKKSCRMALWAFSIDPYFCWTSVVRAWSFGSALLVYFRHWTIGLRTLGTWLYLSMNTSEFGTLVSPRWMTDDPTHPSTVCPSFCCTA